MNRDSWNPSVIWVLTLVVLSNSVSCLAIKHWYPAAGMDDLGVLSPECEHFLHLPYKPVPSSRGKLKAFGTHGFVFVSAYRTTDHSFAVIGLGALSLHNEWGKRKEACLWVSLDGPSGISGKLEYVFPGEHHDLTYEVVIIHCKLESATSDSAGGALFVRIQGEDVMAVKETAGKRSLNPQAPFPHKLTFCSPPITHRMSIERIWESMVYMAALGVDHFVLYDAGGLQDQAGVTAKLAPFFQAGLVDVVNITQQYKFNTWHSVVTVNDCAYRTRFTSAWTLMHEFDDYLYVKPPGTLPGLLEYHKGKPWFTVGTMVWSIDHCRPPIEEGTLTQWPVERMEFHWPTFYCVGNTKDPPEHCLSYFGLRRYIVDPRQIMSLEIHRVLDPKVGGVDLDTSEVFINRFSGISQPNALVCDKQVVVGKEPGWWIADDSFAKMMSKARESGHLKGPSVGSGMLSAK